MKRIKRITPTIQDTADAIQALKNHVAQIDDVARLLRDHTDAALRCLDQIRVTQDDPSLQALTRRLERIHERRRMMETGSLTIECERTAGEAWRRLPW